MTETKKSFVTYLIGFITSLKLTIVCLAMGMVLIFVGTIAQVRIGIDQAVEIYFRSVFVWETVPGTTLRVPIMPGGFLVGGVLLLNLVAGHLYRFRLSWRKSGILLAHAGLIVLLLGELFTAMFSRESMMRITEGQTKNYSEAYRETELAVTDQGDPQKDRMAVFYEHGLKSGASFQLPTLPFKVEVRGCFLNSQIVRRSADNARWGSPLATTGIGVQYTARELPRTGNPKERDMTVAWVELVGPGGSLGTWMVSNVFEETQPFTFEGRSYTIELRQRRTYKPYSLTLLDFSHDRYPGTNIPRNFSSRVHLVDPTRNEDREVLIYMNHPLRYDGLAFYQSGYEGETTTVLQVVRNPSRHLPYISCVMVGLGLLIQFGIHLTDFFTKRRAAAGTDAATASA
jgi:hypothetical protein